jgi:hypothetical protein
MDRRDTVNTEYRPYRVDEQARQIILFPDEDYVPLEGQEDPGEIILPLEWGVCPTCRGEGSHVNPSIDSHGLSAEDFYEDPDFAESYHRGDYDVPCHECGGNRVVPTSTDPSFIKAMDDFWREEAADRHTQMMESGGYGY